MGSCVLLDCQKRIILVLSGFDCAADCCGDPFTGDSRASEQIVGFAGSRRRPSVWGRGVIASFDLLPVLKVELLHECLVPVVELDKSPAMNSELWKQPIWTESTVKHGINRHFTGILFLGRKKEEECLFGANLPRGSLMLGTNRALLHRHSCTSPNNLRMLERPPGMPAKLTKALQNSLLTSK